MEDRPAPETRAETVREDRREGESGRRLEAKGRDRSNLVPEDAAREAQADTERRDPAMADPQDLRRDPDLKGGSTG